LTWTRWAAALAPPEASAAAAAAALASGGASAAAHLVQVNLTVQEGDERLKRARASEQAAAESAKRTLASIR